MRSRLVGAVCVSAMLMIQNGTVDAASISIYTEIFTPNTGHRSDVDNYPYATNYTANDFIPVIGGTITDVSWWGMYYDNGSPQASDDFTINFYSDTGGTVGGLLATFKVGNAVNRAGTGQLFGDVGNGDIEFFSYQANIGAGIDVLPSSTYWISIFNNTTVDTNDNWFWATNINMTGPGHPSYISSDGTSWNVYQPYPSYFELSAIPVPQAFWLFGSGLLGLIGVASRKKFS